MDSLEKILSTFTEQEVREFNYFLQRHKKSFERKDVALLGLLRSKRKADDKAPMLQLYSKEDFRAFHKLRNRFRHQMERFIVSQNYTDDINSEVLNYIVVAQFFFHKQLVTEGIKYLSRAEEKATQYELYHLLNVIYHIQSERYNAYNGISIEDVVRKKKQNHVLMQLQENILVAQAMVEHRIHVALLNGKPVEIERIINKILVENKLNKKVLESTSFIRHIMKITWHELREKKDFQALEQFLIKKYEELSKKKLLQEKRGEKLHFLYYIASVLAKNRKYDEAEGYAEKLLNDLTRNEGKHLSDRYGHSIILLAGIYFHNNKLDKSSRLLEKHLNDERLDLFHKTLFYIDMAVCYFAKEKYSIATKSFSKLHEHEKYIMQWLGLASLLKIQLAECVVHYELTNYDYVVSRLLSIERKYKKHFRDNMLIREKKFMSILKQMVLKMDILSNQRFQKQVTEFIDIKSIEPGDTEIISFNAWLHSKINNMSYYQTFLNMAR